MLKVYRTTGPTVDLHCWFTVKHAKNKPLKNSVAVKKVRPCSKMASVKRVVNKRGGQEMVVMVYIQVDGKNFNNNNSGQFVSLSQLH